jgi:Domain of unknown function (DUF4430)
VSRRIHVLLAALVAGLALVPGALASDVRIRVEGMTTTIFGPTQPLLATRNTPLDALETASVLGEFYYHVRAASFGNYVDQIGRYAASGSAGWVFKVNGALPPVGADQVQLKTGDTVLWYYAEFGPTGGPSTLDLQKQRRGCYQVWALDDQAKRTRAAGSYLRIGLRTVRTLHGRACIKGRHGLVRAYKPGAVRSQAVA